MGCNWSCRQRGEARQGSLSRAGRWLMPAPSPRPRSVEERRAGHCVSGDGRPDGEHGCELPGAHAAGAPRFAKSLRADNLPRPPIGHSQDDLSTTLIGQRDDVFHQLFKVKAALRLFEFETRTFRSARCDFTVSFRGFDRDTSPSASLLPPAAKLLLLSHECPVLADLTHSYPCLTALSLAPPPSVPSAAPSADSK